MSSAGHLRPELDIRALSIPSWRHVFGFALIALIFIADVVLPRGATPAIGYCLIPVILRGSRPALLLGATIFCTVLTIAGYWEEPLGAQPWMSIFDRAMVGGVLWLTFILVRRRDILVKTLVEQTEALRVVADELRRSNADLERFASTAAHDLRGPLGAVGLLARVLGFSSSVKADAEATELVDSIQSELQRMSGFVQSLLAYGRAGARDVETSDCDCSAILSRVKQSLKAEMDSQGVLVTSGPLPTIQADPLLIARLFQNLIENSIKYHGDAPPKIHISAATQPDGSWLFRARDNGVGLRPEDCERIFAPFSQVHKSDSAAGGIGLGLATCKKIVERHGGRIWVKSHPGDGATFMFTIPHPAKARALDYADSL